MSNKCVRQEDERGLCILLCSNAFQDSDKMSSTCEVYSTATQVLCNESPASKKKRLDKIWDEFDQGVGKQGLNVFICKRCQHVILFSETICFEEYFFLFRSTQQLSQLQH